MTETDKARELRQAIARHLAELHRVNIALAADSRALKVLTTEGRPIAEIEIAAEMLEQYMAATAAFLENMRGRFENRLGLLRRGDPAGPELVPGQGAPGHGPFWYAFSRLCVALRLAERRAG